MSLTSFCGHARPGDLASQPFLVEANIKIVPFDIAHDKHTDFLDTQVQHRLLDLVAAETLAGLLASPPCETWSVTRFAQPGKPPLSSWVLPALSLECTDQVETANKLMVITFRLAFAATWLHQFVLFEHTREPRAAQAASIWRTDAMASLGSAPHQQGGVSAGVARPGVTPTYHLLDQTATKHAGSAAAGTT